ncbi:MAG: PAS domain S-box protein, partial [Syntrophales bacterium]
MLKRFVNPALSALLCLVLLIWQLTVAALAQAQPQNPLDRKNVLVLYSEDKAHPGHELTDRGIRSVFQSNKLFDVQLYTEYLDLSRFSGPDYTRTVTDYLGRKYAGLKIDAIITIYPAALDILLGEAIAGFPGVPIVACEILRDTAENLERSPSRRFITGVVIGHNIAGMLDSAFQMRPDTKHIALVAGTSTNDAHSERIVRKGLESYAKKIDLIDLTKLPMQETLARVGSLPPNTIVLYAALFTDGAGQSFVPREALALISRTANAPVFGLYDSYLGYGIVGGRLVSFEQQGREAVTLALRIMGGESPASIPFGGEQAYVNLYDWRELKRWGLDESAVPADAIILNKPVSAWEMYKFYILGAVAFCLLETALIILLIVQRSRKKVAEEAVNQFFNVSLDLKCIANSDGYFLRLNPAWEMTLGYTLGELMAKRFLEFVHPDDLDKTREAVSTLASQQKVTSFENRYRCKDGTYRWLEWISVPAGKLIYAAARDVTGRKQMEEAVRKSEARLKDITFSMADWVWEVDENGVYTYSSQKGPDLLGRSIEDVIGKTPFDFMPPDEAKRVAAIFSEIVANKAPIKDLENWNIRKNGESICLLTNGVPMLDKEGNLKGYRGVDKDVTERKQPEVEVARAHSELLHLERLSRLGELTASL